MEREKLEVDSRIVRNLLQCGELTDLCLELRKAVLMQTNSGQDVEKLLMAQLRQSKDQAWHRNPS